MNDLLAHTTLFHLCTDTPNNLGALCTENKWGNLCPSEVESYVGPMKMPLTYVHLQRRDVVPVNLDLDQCVGALDDKATEGVAQWV